MISWVFSRENERKSISVRLRIRSYLQRIACLRPCLLHCPGFFLADLPEPCTSCINRFASMHCIVHHVPIVSPTLKSHKGLQKNARDCPRKGETKSSTWYPWLVHIPAAGDIWSTVAARSMIDRYHQCCYVVGHAIRIDLTPQTKFSSWIDQIDLRDLPNHWFCIIRPWYLLFPAQREVVFKRRGAIGPSLPLSHVRKDEDHCEGNNLESEKHAQLGFK